jgi:hypothetical protein
MTFRANLQTLNLEAVSADGTVKIMNASPARSCLALCEVVYKIEDMGILNRREARDIIDWILENRPNRRTA